LLGSGLASNVFNVNLTTGLTTYNYAVNVNGNISYYNAGNLNAIITSGAAANGRMYIYSSATADIGLQAGGSSWFLNSLGIGTNAPANKLDVVGDARIQGGGAVSYAVFNLLDNTASGSNWAILSGFPALGDFTIRESGVANQLIIKKTTGNATFLGSVTATSFIKTGGTASQYLMADGSVTIGGGGGSQWTTVGDSIYFNGKTSIGTTQFATNSKLLVGDYLSAGTSAIAQFNGFIRIKDQIIIHNSANTALESDIICQASGSLQTNGNFSIGTASVISRLTIYQGSSSTSTMDNGITLGNGNGATGNMVGIKFGTYGDAPGSLAYAKQFIAGWRSAEGSGFGDLILGNYQGSDGVGVARYEDTALRIKKSGNVIIGAYNTTDIQPTLAGVRLQVNGGIHLHGSHISGYGLLNIESNDACFISLNSTTSYDVRIRYKYLSVDRWYVGMIDDLSFKWQNADSATRLTLTQAGTLTAVGDVVAYSDIRFKENIRPIENVLNRIGESRGVLYDRKDSGEKNNIGFIAQELELQFPELVNTDNDGIKSVKYQNAVAILFEAIKEQQKQIDNLKKQAA
jgi:hypothetical protein